MRVMVHLWYRMGNRGPAMQEGKRNSAINY